MRESIRAVNEEIMEKITPTPEDRARIDALAKHLEQNVASACAAQNIKAIVRVEGSVAKDTWIRGEPDIDVFMRLPTSIPRKALGEISLKIAREATRGSKQTERFAEHPYLEAFIDGTRVNIVPCYNVKPGEWQSATDRTPLHTDYVRKHLDKTLQGEVRLLKKFLKGIASYGAEIKTGGFSGYLCELLILHYKSFFATLKGFAHYTSRLSLDMEDYYKGRERELQLLFPEPLVVVDPVDKGRNVASAVQQHKLHMFIAAARAYLKNPRVDFFYPPKTKALSAEMLRRKMENHGSVFLFTILSHIEVVADVLWGQLYKTERALRKQVELGNFKVLRAAVWSDEKTMDVFVLELEQRTLSSVKKRVGPPLEREKECEDFLSKYTNNHGVVSGPFIKDGRWVVELEREQTDITEFLFEKLKNGGKDSGVAELVSKAFREKLEILVNAEAIDVYQSNKEFLEFLTEFLSGKPFWVESTQNR
jgi:tRNA nucleotidyltransferase (CCA-adding enzyme)